MRLIMFGYYMPLCGRVKNQNREEHPLPGFVPVKFSVMASE
jgi:hypothetical protein